MTGYEDQVIEKMNDIERSIDKLTLTIQYAFSGTNEGMGVVEGGFARSHDRLDRIATALETIAENSNDQKNIVDNLQDIANKLGAIGL